VNLSPREREVAEGIAARLTYRQIASKLGITRKTVEIHATHLYMKMRAAGVDDPRAALRDDDGT
jgi:DNA-binding CsgD family transcriptional regulator